MPMAQMAMPIPMQQPSMFPETFARDSIIAWFRGEFAAANAIIDALCNHLTHLDGIACTGAGGGSEYESVFAAIHRRRLNWIPVLQMQKYFSIADVALELKKVAAKKIKRVEDEEEEKKKMLWKEEIKMCLKEEIKMCLKEEEEEEKVKEKEEASLVAVVAEREISVEEVKETVQDAAAPPAVPPVPESPEEEDSVINEASDPKVVEEGVKEEQISADDISICSSQDTSICSNHEDCETRRASIKMTKGFMAKESVKGHMVNVVKGLKLYDDIFTGIELSKLTEYINELHRAGQNGELPGETFTLFNQQLKGNKRELIQLGVPIFGQVNEDGKCNIEPIPPVLQAVIDHLIQWHLIPESRKPNSCIINFFDEGEFSQPYLKPPHLDQPISSLFLSESTMAFGRVLVSDKDGNYKGPLMLTLKEGSLLVMRGNSADMARHVMCPSSNKRVSITFCRVRPAVSQPSPIAPLTKAMTLWQPGLPQSYRTPSSGVLNGIDSLDVVPKWGVVHHPLVMLAPMRPVVMSPRRLPRGGTGVFLPWTVGPKKHMKHLPPRAQRERLLALPAPSEKKVIEPTPPEIAV